MTFTLPGLGVATPLPDLLAAYGALVHNLPAVIDRHPAARVVRNRVGNLSIVAANEDGSFDDVGWIDVRTGTIDLRDEPWPIQAASGASHAERCPRCGARVELTRYDVCAPCTAAEGWDPPCVACKAEGRGQTADIPHVDTCGGTPKEGR